MKQLIEKIEKLKYEQRTSTGQLIASLLHDCYIRNEWYSLKRVAELCHVSESTVTVFAQKVGCDGYRQLVTILKLESERQNLIKYKAQESGAPEEIINEFDESVMDYISEINEEKYKTIFLANEIKKSSGVKILGSATLKDELSYFADLISSRHRNVQYLKPEYGAYLERIFKAMKEDEIFLIFLTGPGNEPIIEFYERAIKDKFRKIFLFATDAQRYKIDNLLEYFRLDSDLMPNQLMFRKLRMNHLFIHLFLLL
ncbi:hypothetical protein [[Acholeplasma] multilocale]|uniref:hypothetical protein n=1 Tax=[Acholeplasma] multilocale TaxID=264638 RepID=UPI00047E25F6|nr:hypothetical protein [[Acholeplasma] multilocale]